MSQAQKTPFARTMNDFSQQKIENNINSLGKVLPCVVVAVEGAIVTVNFEVYSTLNTPLPPVTCATIGSQYIRTPIQVGDLGICISADVRLGGINGLGAGLAPLDSPASNLGALVFVPIGSSLWEEVNPLAVVIQAPDGASLADTAGDNFIKVTNTGIQVSSSTSLTLSVGSNTISITSSGISITGTLTINGKPFLAHQHTGVTTGSGVSGGVSP